MTKPDKLRSSLGDQMTSVPLHRTRGIVGSLFQRNASEFREISRGGSKIGCLSSRRSPIASVTDWLITDSPSYRFPFSRHRHQASPVRFLVFPEGGFLFSTPPTRAPSRHDLLMLSGRTVTDWPNCKEVYAQFQLQRHAWLESGEGRKWWCAKGCFFSAR